MIFNGFPRRQVALGAWRLHVLRLVLMMPLLLWMIGCCVLAKSSNHLHMPLPLLYESQPSRTFVMSTEPALEILFPSNDQLLARTDLQVEIAIRRHLLSYPLPQSQICIGMKPVHIPNDLPLESLRGTNELKETCFARENVNYTTFHVAGLVPGLRYGVVVSLTTTSEHHVDQKQHVVCLSMRTFQVASIFLQEMNMHVSIADALDTAVQLHQQGHRTNAAAIYRKILQLFPNHMYAMHLLGLSLYQEGQVEAAFPYIQRAVQANASDENFHNSMGLCLKAMGRTRDAIKHFRRALEIRPSCLEASLNLGDAWQSIGDWEEAMHEYRKVVGTLLDASFDKSTKPNHEKFVQDASGRMCELVRVSDGWYEAERCLLEAIARWPNEAVFHTDRGNLQLQAGQFETALHEFQQAAALGSITAQINVADVLEAMGETEQSLEQYENILMAAAASPEPVPKHWMARLMVMKATVLPRILPATQELIDAYRGRFEDDIDLLLAKVDALGDRVDIDPSRIAFSTAITMNAHNRNNKQLKTKLATLYQTIWMDKRIVREEYVTSYAITPLPYRQQIRWNTTTNQRRRIRVGFISRFIFNPAVGLFMRELIPQLDRTKYETFVFSVGLAKSMKVMEQVDQIAEHIVALPRDLRVVRDEVRAAQLDMIVYPELGMDKTTYFLSFHRLAPIQAVWWGNADAVCVPTIDFYLLSEYEHPSFRNHYCIQPFQMKGMGVYHHLPDLPDVSDSTRDDVRHVLQERFDLPSDFHFYLTIESILHMHPDFDQAIHSILESDPQGHVFLLSSSNRKRWTEQLLQRMQLRLVTHANMQRLHIFFDVDSKQELTLLHAADAVLGSIHLTRPKAAMQAFTAGVPVVTLPGEFWGSRITYGFYQRMAMNDLIATDLDSYVRLAVKLAQNPKFRERMTRKVRRRRARLSQDRLAVDEWERFFDFATGMLPDFQNHTSNITVA